MQTNKINIFLSSDNNYAPFVATTIASICDNTKSFCDFFILDGGIKEENKEKIKKLNEQFDNFSIEFLPINPIELMEKFEYKNQSTYVSISTYNRFFITELKPELEKAIYLDVDIIVLGDIKELFEQDLDSKTLGLIPDEGENEILIQFKNKFKLNKYYNAGVLLIDLKQWKEKNYSEKALDFEHQNRNSLNFADQDIINVIFKDDLKELSGKFNKQLSSDETTVIRHFLNIYKPWKFNYFKIGNNIKPLDNYDDFWKYAKITEFYNELENMYETSINSNMLIKRLSIMANKRRGSH